MRDISLHLLDLMQNSIRAGASHVALDLRLWPGGALDIRLSDDGRGMGGALLQGAGDPFVTSRRERRVGLGVPLCRANAEKTGGWLRVDSAPGRGCRLDIRFETANLDCLPLGALDQTMVSLIQMNPLSPAFSLSLTTDQAESRFDTEQLRRILGPEVPLTEPPVIAFISQMLSEQLRSTLGGIMD